MVNSRIADIRKLLPTMALGVVITLLAALCNYVIYDRRLPAMATGNRIFRDSGDEQWPILRAPLQFVAGVVNLSDDMAQDLMFAARGAGGFPSTKKDIVVVAIDEDSMVRHGSWPWPRSDIALLMEKVSSARVVGMDLLFPENDLCSLLRYVPRFDELYGSALDLDGLNSADPTLLDNDVALGRQVARIPTVLGMVLYDGMAPRNKPSGLKSDHPAEVRAPTGEAVPGELALLKNRSYALTDIAPIRDVTPSPVGEGFMNVFPTPAGVVRTMPLFAHLSDAAFANPTGRDRHIVPSMALEIMRVAMGGNGYRIDLRGDLVNIPEFRDDTSNGDRYAVKSVSILHDDNDLLTIPLNELAEIEIGFRNHRNDYTVVSAWEVLAGVYDEEEIFRDRIVIIGGTVEGVGYVISSGMPDPEISVPDAHATMLSAMLKGDFMDGGFQDGYSWQQLAILASGLLVTVAIIFGDLAGGMLVSGLALLGIVLGNYFFFFKRGMDIGITLPILSTLAVLAALMTSNYLVVGRERRFIRKAFQLNVSPSILGYLESHPDRLGSLQGDYRHMTVLFSDIRSFTTMSEQMSAPDVARFLNEYFTPMSDIVMDNTGTVDKFIGDGLMAFWNAPADNPNHARDAARSALDMLARLEDLQPGWTARGLPRIAIGCGINTGPMFAGYMGSEQRKNYTVMGDNVNIASRLENLNKVYSSSILITESTRAELGNEFVCRVVDKVRVSGKAEAVVIHELLGAGPATEERYEELATFARVFELYQEREFATAESLLKELVFIRPAPLYKMYLDRLAIYKALPPPDDWDGTFSMTHK